MGAFEHKGIAGRLNEILHNKNLSVTDSRKKTNVENIFFRHHFQLNHKVNRRFVGL